MARITSERFVGLNVGLGFVAALLTGWLVVSELFREPTCPPILGIPACFLVLAGYVAATFGAWKTEGRKAVVLFYVGIAVVVAIGIWFSLGEIQARLECPRFEGLPMCFLSLFAGCSMVLLDQLRRNPRSSDSYSN